VTDIKIIVRVYTNFSYC